jgi:hypothetical protein
MYKFLFLFLLMTFSIFSFGQHQKLFAVTEEYSMKLEPSSNFERAKIDCVERAKANAIKKKFGELLIQGNTTYLRNTQSSSKVETLSRFNMIADSWVNGEWVEDLQNPEINVETINKEVWIKAKVKGNIRELTSERIDFKVITTECPKASCETESFHEGDDFYIVFKSPISGYLSIFLDDPYNNTTYMIFPYQAMLDSSQILMERDKEYVLFDPKLKGVSNPSLVDEMIISLANKDQPEINKLFVLFSPNTILKKPQLNDRKTYDQGNNIFLPSKMKSDDFQMWVAKLRSKFKDVQFSYKYINLNPTRN